MGNFGRGLLGALLLAPGVALAQGFVDIHYVAKSNLKETYTDPDPSLNYTQDTDGDGFGIRGLLPTGSGFALTGEYQSTSHDFDVDVDQFRVGIGMVGPTTSGVFLEYDKFDVDANGGSYLSMDGLAVHGRLAGKMSPTTEMYGDVGYATLHEDNLDTDFKGLEFNAGLAFGINETTSILVDYRLTNLKASEFGSTLEEKVSAFRLGVRVGFGG